MSAEITEEKDVMSGPEAEEFIEELKKVFSIVRLLDKDNFEHMERHYNEHGEVPCQCYEIWKRKAPVKTVFPPRPLRMESSGQNWNL